jgi:predicted amidohydrolase YtcJ
MNTQQTIQERSYSIWEREGRPHGRHLEHWAQAESELLAEVAPPPKRPRAKRAKSLKTDTKLLNAGVGETPHVTH